MREYIWLSAVNGGRYRQFPCDVSLYNFAVGMQTEGISRALGSGCIDFRFVARFTALERCGDKSDRFWLTDALMVLLAPFFPKLQGRPLARLVHHRRSVSATIIYWLKVLTLAVWVTFSARSGTKIAVPSSYFGKFFKFNWRFSELLQIKLYRVVLLDACETAEPARGLGQVKCQFR